MKTPEPFPSFPVQITFQRGMLPAPTEQWIRSEAAKLRAFSQDRSSCTGSALIRVVRAEQCFSLFGDIGTTWFGGGEHDNGPSRDDQNRT